MLAGETSPSSPRRFRVSPEKFPQAKKATAQWCQAAFLEQGAIQLGKKLKWW